MIFRLELAPATISILARGIFNSFDKNFSSSIFASPSTGGAASRTLTASPCIPTISVLEARGWMYSETRTDCDNIEPYRKVGVNY